MNPAVTPVPSGLVPALTVYSFWQLPSSQIVQIRSFIHPTETEGRGVECVVRNVNDDAQLAHGEYSLTLAFIAQHGKPVMKGVR